MQSQRKARLSKTMLIAAAMLAVCAPEPTAVWAASGPAQNATAVDQAAAGEVRGKVAFEGPKPSVKPIQMKADRACAALHQSAAYEEDGQVNNNGTLPNVFVFIKSGADTHTFTVPKNPVTLDQVGCLYQPHVLGIMVGQKLKVLNSDPTVHNTHVAPADMRAWNQSQLPGAAPFYKIFSKPAIMIPVSCNAHPWMRAYIGVTTNPFYAVTGPEGTYTIKSLPAGEYTLEAWTATFGKQEQKVTVRAKEATTVDFTFREH